MHDDALLRGVIGADGRHGSSDRVTCDGLSNRIEPVNGDDLSQ